MPGFSPVALLVLHPSIKVDANDTPDDVAPFHRGDRLPLIGVLIQAHLAGCAYPTPAAHEHHLAE
jgi:hypothetical protein